MEKKNAFSEVIQKKNKDCMAVVTGLRTYNDSRHVSSSW